MFIPEGPTRVIIEEDIPIQVAPEFGEVETKELFKTNIFEITHNSFRKDINLYLRPISKDPNSKINVSQMIRFSVSRADLEEFYDKPQEAILNLYKKWPTAFIVKESMLQYAKGFRPKKFLKDHAVTIFQKEKGGTVHVYPDASRRPMGRNKDDEDVEVTWFDSHTIDLCFEETVQFHSLAQVPSVDEIKTGYLYKIGPNLVIDGENI